MNRQEFLRQYSERRVPWILLHAMCFMAVTFCPQHMIHRARYESRRQARWSFYSKAKALFDAGYEGNKIVILQVAIMMSFWGGGPNNYWNFYSWISTAVTIAETLGIHRSLAGTHMHPCDRSLLKRLWWILVVRDTACATLVGRPFRINLDHSDVDPLKPDDFSNDVAVALTPAADQATPEQLSHHVFGLYQVQIVNLCLILRRIITSRFSPKDFSDSDATLAHLLSDWRSRLPSELDWEGGNGLPNANMFSSTLAIMYNHNVILTYINSPPEQLVQDISTGMYSGMVCAEDMTRGAAQHIASMACAVVTKSDALLVPHELFHGIFLAAVVFYTQTKNPQPIVSQLGTAGLTNCVMALHESREFWDPSPWITQLFDKLMGTVSRQGSPGLEEDILLASMQSFADGDPGLSLRSDPMFPTGYDIWHGHPVLGNLFEGSPAIQDTSTDALGGDGADLGPWSLSSKIL